MNERSDQAQDEQVELFSPEWIELARAFLVKRVAELGDAVRGTQFAICEVATDPPAHLAQPGSNRLGWHVVFDGPNVTVGQGEIDCPFKSEIDYQAVLPIARTVYRENPEALAAQRDRRSESRLPQVPAVLQPVLLELHDHLARRTA